MHINYIFFIDMYIILSIFIVFITLPWSHIITVQLFIYENSKFRLK